MIAVDTNILVYAAHSKSPWHDAASARLTELAEGSRPWAIPWPCLHEFYSVVTNPRAYQPPMTSQQAVGQLGLWMESPSLQLIGESAGYWEGLSELIETGRIIGAMIHDARIAAICLQHGVNALWTADRDFTRFPTLNAINPLITR